MEMASKGVGTRKDATNQQSSLLSRASCTSPNQNMEIIK